MIAHRDVLCSRQSLNHSRIFRCLDIDIATIDKRDEINRIRHFREESSKSHVLVYNLAVLEHELVAIVPANKHFAWGWFRIGRSLNIAAIARIGIVNRHSVIKYHAINRQMLFIGKERIIVVTSKHACIFSIATQGIKLPCKLIRLHFFCGKSKSLGQSTCIFSYHIKT